MRRPDKVAEVEILTTKMSKSAAVVLADYTGLTVADMGELRKQCLESKVEFRVVKNRLAKLAAAEADMSILDDLLKGPTGIAFCEESPVDPAKVLVGFMDKNDKMVLKGGFLDGQVLSAAEVVQLAKIPSRDELISMIMRTMQAPVSGFVGVLAGSLRKLMGTLEAVAEQKQAQG